MGVVRVHQRERGTVTVIMAGVIVVVGALLWWLGVLGRATTERAQAQTAADAAALAGAASGEASARELAAANGAVLVGFASTMTGDGGVDVAVSVEIGEAGATASAHYQPPPPIPDPPVETTVPTETTLSTSTTVVVDRSPPDGQP